MMLAIFCGGIYAARNGWKMLREHFEDHIGAIMVLAAAWLLGRQAWL